MEFWISKTNHERAHDLPEVPEGHLDQNHPFPECIDPKFHLILRMLEKKLEVCPIETTNQSPLT